MSSYDRGVDAEGIVHYSARFVLQSKKSYAWCDVALAVTRAPTRRANVTCLCCLIIRQDRL